MSDPIKDAFTKVKEDISELQNSSEFLNSQLNELRDIILHFHHDIRLQNDSLQELKNSVAALTTNQQTNKPTQESSNPTDKSSENPQPHSEKFVLNQNPTENPTNNPSDPSIQQKNPTEKSPLYSLKPSNLSTSTGNEGVPTNKQTNQQTHTQQSETSNSGFIDRLANVAELADSLDDLKREVRLKLKRLTKQEMLVFSTIYQCEEQGFLVDYPLLAQKLSLSESSIRDLSQRLIKKGIPIVKTKENNKKIYLSITQELKKVASLATILQLREL